jgi:acetyltransferase-like isoleucine patch superfamily enzyme
MESDETRYQGKIDLIKLAGFKSKCRAVETSFIAALFRHMYFRLRHKKIRASKNVLIRGLDNITTGGLVEIGMNYVGFIPPDERTYLNIHGRLIFNDSFTVGKGCAFDIGEKATAEFGRGYVTGRTTFIIMHGLKIGDGCAISWGCQFLDDDFHHLDYPGKKEKGNKIEIGDHVWIGSDVTLLKGVVIPDGCVIASGSTVTSSFITKNCLIVGSPARIIKENISWA